VDPIIARSVMNLARTDYCRPHHVCGYDVKTDMREFAMSFGKASEETIRWPLRPSRPAGAAGAHISLR
jgi:hypothetical protein